MGFNSGFKGLNTNVTEQELFSFSIRMLAPGVVKGATAFSVSALNRYV